MLREAVAIQDTLKYGEPPRLVLSRAGKLGSSLLMTGDAAVQKSFPRRPRPLTCAPALALGTAPALLKQKRGLPTPASSESNSKPAWKGGAAALKLDDLV